ncbi:Cytochrome b/b6 domain protein [Solidesulfovibrio fructosivorans JJ]]|uniref:Cytochrome b/b6 domain protein n=1 Tax=Solidesulfovibrio fructosivorans JJ] TaxID=596151 RepID=E1JSR0_SOLFR|nr:cytochrome b N-terminal domain-containing protein [Solidesulfovibrio fructosivorans]EFL52543.1 Cytochrome b/b6 domain protein [Solidesulfovibrio fructosivorans JJ]]
MASSRKSVTDLILHLHPPSVPAATLRFRLSFGLGGMAVTLAGLLFVTGLLLLLAYRPETDAAYGSILVITREVPFGPFVRNIHHASANLLVAVALLHLFRVAATGAFGPGRRLNWIIGLALLALVLAANFTGYLLPWDQLAYWAVTICTSMLSYVPLGGQWLLELFRGGTDIGQPTLANFFVLHVAAVPGLLIAFSFWHFWLVRRAGGLVRSGEEGGPRLPTVPHLLAREAAVGLSLIAFVLLVAMVWDAPLLAQANPALSPNPAKAPWYFQGFQELLLHLDPVFAVCIWPLLGAAALLAVPFWPGSALPPGDWFGSPRGRRLAAGMFAAGLLLTTGVILLDNFLPVAAGPSGSAWITRGLLPTFLVLAVFAGAYRLLVKTWGAPRAEAVMACLCLALAGLVVCTVVGVWFRGPEMRLVWPLAQGGASTP